MTRALIAAAVALAVPAAAAGDPLAHLQALWYGADRAAFTETVLEDGEPVAKIKYRVDPPRVRLEVYDYAQSRTRPVHLLVGRGEGLYRIGPSGAVPVDRTEEGWDDPHLQIALLPWMDSVEADLGEGVLEGRWGPLRKRVWLDGTGRPVRFQVEGPELRRTCSVCRTPRAVRLREGELVTFYDEDGREVVDERPGWLLATYDRVELDLALRLLDAAEREAAWDELA